MEIGTEVIYTHPKGHKITGTLQGIRRSGSTIRDTDTGEAWPGVQFKVKPADGSRAFWTITFPDVRKQEA